MRYEGLCNTSVHRIHNIQFQINAALAKQTFKQHPTDRQLLLLSDLGFRCRFPPRIVKLVRWIPPDQGLVLNVDGASKGNPGPCGGGGCIRDSRGKLVLAFSFFYGVGSCLVAETWAMCDGIRLANEHGLSLSGIRTDSAALATSLCLPGVEVDWVSLRWWREINQHLTRNGVNVSHVYREANRVADALASFACHIKHNTVFHSPNDLPRACFGSLITDQMGLVSLRL